MRKQVPYRDSTPNPNPNPDYNPEPNPNPDRKQHLAMEYALSAIQQETA